MVDSVSRRAALPPVTSATLPESCDPAGKQRGEWLLFGGHCISVCLPCDWWAAGGQTHTHTHVEVKLFLLVFP